MKTKSILIIVKIGISILVVIIIGILYIGFHESTEDKQLRISNDRNVYWTIRPDIIHLDKNCKRIKRQIGYSIQSKSELYIYNLDAFCTECCTTNDIDVLKNQIRTVYNHY